jgi:hypothetical protein
MNDNIRSDDSIRYKKDCADFVCLNDGTIYRECKYCELSRQCKQIDFVDGEAIPMESHYCPVKDPNTGELIEWEYYCTGKHDIRSRNERIDDDKIS